MTESEAIVLVRRIYWLALGFGLAGSFTYFGLQGWRPALGFALGALGSVGNLWLFERLTHWIEPSAEESSEEHTQDGRGAESSAQSISEFLSRMAARIRALCALREHAQDGRGAERSAKSTSEFLSRMAARIRTLCAPRKPWEASAFIARYAVMVLVAYVIVKTLGVNALAVILGLLTSTAAVLTSALIEVVEDLFAGRSSN